MKDKLTAINQYLLHARMVRNWSFSEPDDYEYEESVDEMRHADRLIERILRLEGLPNLQDLRGLRIGEEVPEALKSAVELKHDVRADFREAIAYCESVAYLVGRELVGRILDAEGEHIDWLETQIDFIDRVGF